MSESVRRSSRSPQKQQQQESRKRLSASPLKRQQEPVKRPSPKKIESENFYKQNEQEDDMEIDIEESEDQPQSKPAHKKKVKSTVAVTRSIEFPIPNGGFIEIKKRGRPKKFPSADILEIEPSVVLDDGFTEIDEKGERKVDQCGNLLEGRTYNIRTFRLPSRSPTILWTTTMDVCRILGYRDSYMFFAKAPQIPKEAATDEDKEIMIDLGIVGTNVRSRTVPIVQARMVFRCFGWRVVSLGRPVRDDYWTSNLKPEEIALLTQTETPVVQHVYTPITDPSSILSTSILPPPIAEQYTKIILAAPVREQHLLKSSFEAAEFNAHLRSSRKEAFFDIHTGLEQVPKLSQYETLSIERNPGQGVDDFVYGPGEGVGLAKVKESGWERIEIDGDDRYPFALLDGQKCGSASIYRERFSGKDKERLKKFGVKRLPVQQQQEVTGVEHVSYAEEDEVAENDDDEDMITVFVCGVANKNGNGNCRRVVAKEGDHCPHHAAIHHYNINQTSLCCHCESNIPPSSSDSEPSVIPTSILLKCCKCSLFHHPVCVELDDPTLVSRITQTDDWTCPACKLCVECKETGDEAKMLFCDLCDNAFHMYCLKPVLKELPEGEWYCKSCSSCKSCKKTTSTPEFALAPTSNPTEELSTYMCTYCKDCNVDFQADRVCPICFGTYAEDSDIEMVCCDNCDRWVHRSCDPELTEERYKVLVSDEREKYVCVICNEKKEWKGRKVLQFKGKALVVPPVV